MNTPGEKLTVSPWRRLWHLVGGSVFPVLALFVTREVLLITLGGVTFIFLALEVTRFVSPGINQWTATHLGFVLKKKERFRPTGTTYLLLASVAVFFFFEKYVAVTALLFLALGDFMAAVIGQKYGHHRLAGKSLEGSLACLVSCIIIGLLMTLSHEISVPAVLVGAAAATLVELLPLPLDDNLTVPLAGAGIMALLS